MAPHSSTLAWRIPWTGDPGGLQSMGSQSRTRRSDFTFTFHFHALEKEMATHSSILAWRVPGMGEPGGLPSQGSHRVGHDWSDLAAAAAWWSMGFPGGTSGKEPACQCRRCKKHGFHPWDGKISWRRSTGMATNSNILAWEIPWTEECGGLQSMGSQRIGHNWAINTFTSVTNGSFPGGASGKEPTCRCRKHEMWVQSLGWEESDTTEVT